ncbi:hypothetical protein Pmani_001176 [Petrolisthes manimaculis]|uniref:Uncharacterized protein n=1 Tax=Petrolisthes manimaculis TaxID=1843537 RepID=A0AAE1UKK2_9EUCA|nr:hypothetical protein Pmani_001176 [Petrolisthes manimaculis]
MYSTICYAKVGTLPQTQGYADQLPAPDAERRPHQETRCRWRHRNMRSSHYNKVSMNPPTTTHYIYTTTKAAFEKCVLELPSASFCSLKGCMSSWLRLCRWPEEATKYIRLLCDPSNHVPRTPGLQKPNGAYSLQEKLSSQMEI